MITLFSFLLTFLAILFWIFRVVVTLFYQLEIPFFAVPLNVEMEIVVLFLTIPCIMLVLKRNIVGAAIYLAIYVCYFGQALYNSIMGIQTTGVTILGTTDLAILCIGVLIPILTFLDILLNKNRANFNANQKTDWFYKNEAFDRKFDERADRNQYKIR